MRGILRIGALAVAVALAVTTAGCTTTGTPHPRRESTGSPSAPPVPPTPKRVEDLALTLSGSTHVVLHWGKPDLNGGSDVIRYGVATWIVVDGKQIFFHYVYVDSTAATTTFAVPRLETGTSYAFGVKAYNANNRDADYGNIVTTVTGVTDSKARPPRTTLHFVRPRDVEDDVGTSNTNQVLTFQWRKPSTRGGYGIAHYLLDRRVFTDGRWNPVDIRTITDPAPTVRYVYYPETAGTEYEVRLRTVTMHGTVSAWGPWNRQTIYRIDRSPAAPETPRVTARTSTTVTLTDARPGANGGYFVDKFWVTTEEYEDGAWKQVAHTIYPSGSGSLKAVVTKLRPRTTYRFRVSAVNYLGNEGPQSPSVTTTTRS
jgi:hypothetical protein